MRPSIGLLPASAFAAALVACSFVKLSYDACDCDAGATCTATAVCLGPSDGSPDSGHGPGPGPDGGLDASFCTSRGHAYYCNDFDRGLADLVLLRAPNNAPPAALDTTESASAPNSLLFRVSPVSAEASSILRAQFGSSTEQATLAFDMRADALGTVTVDIAELFFGGNRIAFLATDSTILMHEYYQSDAGAQTVSTGPVAVSLLGAWHHVELSADVRARTGFLRVDGAVARQLAIHPIWAASVPTVALGAVIVRNPASNIAFRIDNVVLTSP